MLLNGRSVEHRHDMFNDVADMRIKIMCTSFEIEKGNRDRIVRCVTDTLMSLSNDIDGNILLSLDSDLLMVFNLIYN